LKRIGIPLPAEHGYPARIWALSLKTGTQTVLCKINLASAIKQSKKSFTLNLYPMPSRKKEFKKVTTNVLQEMKRNGEKISMLTAYDYTMAKIVDKAGIDVILVGDSASNVMAGHETTLPITLDQMIYHASSVIRATDRALVVVDLPFGSYQGNSKEALNSSIRIMKESGAHSVKLEGGKEVIESVARILTAGIPVMGHLGLTPQSIYKFGTYTVRAKEEEEADRLLADAQLLQEAGCFALVLEKIPASLAEKVSKALTIPVIGIGAGGGVDGQVLVLHDMLGLTTEFSPRFLRRYANLFDITLDAVKNYITDVKAKDFPNTNEQY
jgi:3-methyl-2-oxobutanoate hydroxymethyltransferase